MLRLIVAAIVGGLIGAFISTLMQHGVAPNLGYIAAHIQQPQYADYPPIPPTDMEGPTCTRDKPLGTESLPPGIIHAETDLFPRRLWGKPEEDLLETPKYLLTFTVGVSQKAAVNAAVQKFSKEFQILLFHYDGKVTEWDEYEWSQNAIHISIRKQAKWWYVKRFLHPDVVAQYEYIFIWDEDLDLTHFNARRYLELVEKHGLEVSQPSLDSSRGTTWAMTRHRGDIEVHKVTVEHPGWCKDPLKPPCAGFVEIMAPVFSRKAWRCVWYIIQNDLVHGWGLDFAIRRCVEPAHEKIGVVDETWIIHVGVPSLGNQGVTIAGRAPWEGVRLRCNYEWQIYSKRWKEADARQAELDAAAQGK
ncbi:uncharacterized protein [Physcomitrium patens]|nr:uncharacterized protein LOC112284024 isoform X2 [Physcomitrium patens]XP_024379263.1 uncharacterized protein LOC112284024 isoform X2 [Physcomitrium patens]XP_024379264.1 uncharacterized protein LOC112284024 isoform X2 [Physcomitrium patens]XP_024379265.1 uncharacterized protein LOC112284024 isoform X2 [Physcomitrium patens]XP_024379266.1 uncharacterized protein LOC112284024 isoform X2 [Physcomitrium patens]PNR52133.1 hypothetical protein PHYPA_008507 [Physcomitrium patens]|eukprot:XP_024379262.1 uncharacterized protein LOC112284024 isoform X2 [Physcomitrella patens]